MGRPLAGEQQWRSQLAPSLEFVAAFLAGDDERLLQSLDLLRDDRLHPTVQRLIPMAAARARTRFPDHPAVPVLSGQHRKAHLRNTMLLHRGARLSDLLDGQEGTPVALKGVALALLYYPDLGSRPMSDLDLLVVESTTAEDIVTAGASLGMAFHARQVHAWTLVDVHGLEYDIHRYLSPAVSYRGSAARLLSRARPLTLVEEQPTVRTLDDEGHVAHSLLHSSMWSLALPVRWIADIALIQRARPQLDWTVVAADLHDWGWTTVPRAHLALLADHGLVPDDAVRALGDGDRWLDRHVQSASYVDPRRRPVRHLAQRLVGMPARLYARTAPRGSVARFYGDYLRDTWQVSESTSLPAAFAGKARQWARHRGRLPAFEHADPL